MAVVSNIQRALRTRHPLEIMQLKRIVAKVVVGPLSNSDVERLWETFSHDRKAESGWLPVMEETLADWERWLNDDRP